MARFIVRRLIQMVLRDVRRLGAHVPDLQRDPEQRPGRAHGRAASTSQSTIEAIRKEWGFDEPLPSAVRHDDEEGLHRRPEVVVHPAATSARRSSRGIPRTFSLAIGAALLWMFVAVCFGLYSAVKAGKFADRFLTDHRAGRHLDAGLLDRGADELLPRLQVGWFPNGGYVEFDEDPVDWVYHLILPWTALAILFIGFYSRVLRSNVLDTINEDYVRTARAKGLSRAPGPDPPRAAQLDDPDHHAVGARLRRGDRRRGDPDRDRLRPPGRRAVRGRRRSASSTCRRCSRSRCSRAFFIVLLNAIVDIMYAFLDPRIRLQ